MSFFADDKWQRKMRDRFLTTFYETMFASHLFLDPPQKESCVMWIQKEIGVDTLATGFKGGLVGVEEKIVRWPKDDEAHAAYALETWTCTVENREREGWMYYSMADWLLYAFVQRDGNSMLVDWIPMQPLRRWFFEIVAGDPYNPANNTMRFETYAHARMKTENKTEMRVVPVLDVWGSFPKQCRRYEVSHALGVRNVTDEALDELMLA